MQILSTGEILWDIVEGGEFLGGAPLNFSVTSQKLGGLVSLLTGVGEDELGRKALQQPEDRFCTDSSRRSHWYRAGHS
jgi:fructokinase